MGKLLVILTFAATLFSGWNYYNALKTSHEGRSKSKGKGKGKRKSLLASKMRVARQSFHAMTALICATSVYFSYLILSHQFQYAYVYRYSSRSLSPGLLLSTFWAGQEGSFLLWALYIALLGVVLIKTAKQLEAHAMVFLNLIQAFFLILLIKASPFNLLPQTPADGVGLNPLLQNFWMVIHPPILFLGYAAAAFPVVIALAAYARRDYKLWVSQALPWALVTASTLGAGIIIGAFWAYGVLGWGGYWGWDPVENSSLVPWLTTIALVHGLIVAKVKGALQKTNFLLALVSFVLVLYATFLTRSGVLADFSVHSFENLGINAYLIVFMIASAGSGLYLFARRGQHIPYVSIDTSGPNRENALLVTLWVFLGSALLTLLGTSSPILTKLFGPPSQVQVAFYNTVNLPVAVTMAILLGITPFLKWAQAGNGLIKRMLPSLGLTAISAGIATVIGMPDLWLLLFVVAAAFAFWSNAIVLFQQWKHSWHNVGAPLAHIGVGLMFVGIVVSGNFEQKQTITLTQGVASEILGHRLVFQGYTRQPSGKNLVNITVADNRSGYLARPKLYFSQYNRAMMREPDVKRGLLQDFYLSPLERMQPPPGSDSNTLSLKKGEKKRYGDYDILFTGFDMHDPKGSDGFRVGAKLQISQGDQSFSVTPALFLKGKQREAKPVQLPVGKGNDESKPAVFLKAIDANAKSIQLGFDGLTTVHRDNTVSPEAIILEVSKKPFMNILWLGTLLLIVGSVIAFQRRMANL